MLRVVIGGSDDAESGDADTVNAGTVLEMGEVYWERKGK